MGAGAVDCSERLISGWMTGIDFLHTDHAVLRDSIPDGKWMLLNSTASGSVQLWRQRFPDGSPEQVTFGTTAVSGIAPIPGDRADSQSITYSSIEPDGTPMVLSLSPNDGMRIRESVQRPTSRDCP